MRAIARVVRASESELVVDVPDWPGQRPGQFAMLQLDPTRRSLDPLLPRPMAIFRSEAERVEFRHKVVGRGTALLAALAPDAPLGIVGPLGNGFPDRSGPSVLVGGGTGIASLYELARDTPGCRVLLGGRTGADILALEDFRGLPVELELASEDGSVGHRGRVTELLRAGPGEAVYACGPIPMMAAAHELARKHGARCWVSLENQMACGFGVCLGCAVRRESGFAYVCSDGPVFDADQIQWETLV